METKNPQLGLKGCLLSIFFFSMFPERNIQSGEEMVKKAMYQKIQQLKRQGANRSQISRELGLDRKTVRKYFKMDEQEFLAYQQEQACRHKLMDPFKKELLEIYKLNGYDKLNVAAVYDYLEERFKKLPCTEKSLRNYVAFLIERGELELKGRARVYSEVPQLPYGRQIQLDFGVAKKKNGLTIHIFTALLSASRFKYVAVQDKPFTTETTIKHLLDAFDSCGGRPEELTIDQDRVMVVNENYGDIIYTKDFKHFIEEMELKMYVCRKADPESKGKVENLVKFVKYNFLSVREFNCITEVTESLSAWLSRRANGRISQATKRVPAEEILEERKALRPLKNSIFRKESIIEREERLVSDHCFISYRASHYSVPLAYRKKRVDIYEAAGRLYIYDTLTGKLITEHLLTALSGSRVQNKDHFRDKERRAQELKEQVLMMFNLPGWKEFTELNFKEFRRYVRDQCGEARRHFSGDIEHSTLLEALEFCLENGCYSFGNLSDTYNYFRREKSLEEQTVGVLPAPEGTKVGKVQVKERPVAEYQTLLEKAGGKR